MTDKTLEGKGCLNPITLSLFDKSNNPFIQHYPELYIFIEGIRKSFWTHDEFNFDRDKQDYLVNLTDKEREVIRRTMLAISQVEVTVKRFWADLYHTFPQEEIDAVSTTFAESEVRHKDTYRHLLIKLDLQDDFKRIHENKVLMKRVEYLEKFMRDRKMSKRQEVCALLLFSIFVEHISLFSQFLIMMMFSHRRNMLNTIGQAVQATSKEEELHGLFGITIFHILKEQHPEMFDETFFNQVVELANEAFKTELEIIDWIFEKGDLEKVQEGEKEAHLEDLAKDDEEDKYFLSKEMVINYIKHRYNLSFERIGLPHAYSDVDYISYDRNCQWFDVSIKAIANTDNFAGRNTSYAKGYEASVKSLEGNDLVTQAVLKALGFNVAEYDPKNK